MSPGHKRQVRQIMARLIAEHGAPECIRSDNGPEFVEKELRQWLRRNQIKTFYIEPGSPWQNGHVESFNARLREFTLQSKLKYKAVQPSEPNGPVWVTRPGSLCSRTVRNCWRGSEASESQLNAGASCLGVILAILVVNFFGQLDYQQFSSFQKVLKNL